MSWSLIPTYFAMATCFMYGRNYSTLKLQSQFGHFLKQECVQCHMFCYQVYLIIVFSIATFIWQSECIKINTCRPEERLNFYFSKSFSVGIKFYSTGTNRLIYENVMISTKLCTCISNTQFISIFFSFWLWTVLSFQSNYCSEIKWWSFVL